MHLIFTFLDEEDYCCVSYVSCELSIALFVFATNKRFM